ncbi:p450 domain containing protein, partial [Asbolus verrucosus]
MFISGSLTGDLIGIATALLVTVICYFKWTYQHWRRRNLPYLEPQIPYGNIGRTVKGKENICFTIKRMYDEMKANGWKHGGVYFLLSANYFIVDLDLIKNILTKDFQHFVDRSLYFNEKDDPLSAHLASVTGTRWRNLRSKLTPTFTSGKMKMMFQSLVECEPDLQQQLEAKCEAEEAIDIKDVLARFTTNVIGSCAFGLDCKSFADENSPFRVYGKKNFAPSRRRRLSNMLASGFPWLGHMLGVTTTPKDVADFFIKVVHDTVSYREKNNYTRNDFMQLLIDLKNKRLVDEDNGKIESGGLTMNEVAAQSFVFFSGGFETSSTLMTFTLYELARNQDIQDRLRDEIRTVLAKHDGKISYEAIQEMKYMNQVLDESLRKYPPAGLTNRKCVKDYKVPGEDFIIEKGTVVIIPIYGIHHDEDIYPDPEKFDPERFSEENKRSRHNYTHLPFGEGPRNCIGMRFGLMQAKMGLASVLRNFRFTVNKKTKEPLKMQAYSILLSVEGDMLVSESLFGDLIAIATALLVIFFGYCKWTYQYWRRRNLPYLEPQIPYGNVRETLQGKEHIAFTIKGIYDEMKARRWKHGGAYFLLTPNYFVIDLDYVKNIMTKDFQHFVDRNIYHNEKKDPLSAHLVSITGTRWRNLRSKLTPTFTSGKMKVMFQTLVECEANLQKQMQEKCTRQEPIDIKDVLARFTTNVIGSCAFGLDCKSFEDDNSPFRVYGKKIFAPTGQMRLTRNLASNFPQLARILNVTTTPKDVADFYMKVVKDTVNYREKNNYSRNDFIQLLIDMKNNKFVDEDNEKIEDGGLTMNEVAAQSFVFFLAGFETSSTLMTFTLYELARNQDIQEKLRDEIKTVLAKHEGKITYDSIQELKYMNQVIDESLRKYPPAPLTNRKCVKDYKVPGEDLIIEKGTTVIIPILAIHRDEEYYPDPEKFDPERFSEENKKSRHHYAHIPFGEGPRICIGMRFGLMQAKVGLTSVLRNFRFTVNKKTKEPLKMQINSNILSAEGDWSYQYWRRKNLPYLKPRIPYGNVTSPITRKENIGITIQKIYNEMKAKKWKHGGVFFLTAPTYVVVDLDYVKNVMTKDFHHFVDRGFYHNEKDDPLSAHLFAIGGTKWRNLRTKLTPTFTSGKMKTIDISSFFMKVVKDTVNYREKNNYTRKDFMQLLIDLKNNKLAEEDGYKHDGKTLTVEEIAAQSFVFFLAETLRMYPPVSFITRKCVQDYKIPGEDITIEKGTSVLISVLGIHHDGEYYPDPEKFDPERFSEENKKSLPHYAHIPFGEGPRICIGMRFGLMQSKYWRKKNLPYLEPSIPFGNVGDALKGKENLGITIKRIYDEMKARGWKHGGMYMVLSPSYFLIDLDYVRNILTKDFHHFVDRTTYSNEEDDPLSSHLVSVTGTRWRNLRAKLTPTFTSSKMRTMFQTLVDCEANLQKQMEMVCAKRRPVDIKEVLARFTTDVIGSCAFGLDCKSFEDENSPFRVYGKKHFEKTGIQRLKRIFAMNFPRLVKMLHVTLTPKEVADFFMKIVRETVEYRERNDYRRNDFMQLLIDMKNNKLVGEDGSKLEDTVLTMNEVAAQSFVFFLAGFETSSTLMTFALYELARNQDIQQKLRDEIKTVLAKHDGKITYDAIQEMKYMNQVIDESLRKHPPAPLTTRRCVQDYTIPGEDVIIEKGTT